MSQHNPGTPAPRPDPPRAVAAETEVAEALAELETLDARPPAEHVAVLTAAHDALAAQLSAAES